MDIGYILQNIDFLRMTGQYVGDMERVIKQVPYKHLIQPPQPQDDRVAGYTALKSEWDNRHDRSRELIRVLRSRSNVIRIVSWNITRWKIGDNNIKDIISKQIYIIKPTILCLQEDDNSTDNLQKNDNSDDNSVEEYVLVGRCAGESGVINSVYIHKKSGLSGEVINTENNNLRSKHCGVFIDIKVGDKILFSLGNVKLDKDRSNREVNIQKIVEIMEETSERNKMMQRTDKVNQIIAGDMNSFRWNDYLGVRELGNVKLGKTAKGETTSAVVYLEANGWIDSFVKFFADNDIKDGKVPLNTSVMGGRRDFIFMNRDFDIPILGCYIMYPQLTIHSAVIMDLYYDGN